MGERLGEKGEEKRDRGERKREKGERKGEKGEREEGGRKHSHPNTLFQAVFLYIFGEKCKNFALRANL